MTPQNKMYQLAKLRQHWEQVCDAERRSQERNQKLLRELELLDNKTSTLALQAEQLRMVKDQYKSYVSQIWPLWLEMQKAECVPRSSTPKNVNIRSVVTAEPDISTSTSAVKQEVHSQEFKLKPTNALKMQVRSAFEPRSSGLKKSQMLDKSPLTRSFPISHKYTSKQRMPQTFAGFRTKPVNVVQNTIPNHLPPNIASVDSVHTSLNQHTPAHHRKNITTFTKRNSFAGFPSSSNNVISYPIEAMQERKDSWLRNQTASEIENSPHTLVDFQNMTKSHSANKLKDEDESKDPSLSWRSCYINSSHVPSGTNGNDVTYRTKELVNQGGECLVSHSHDLASKVINGIALDPQSVPIVSGLNESQKIEISFEIMSAKNLPMNESKPISLADNIALKESSTTVTRDIPSSVILSQTGASNTHPMNRREQNMSENDSVFLKLHRTTSGKGGIKTTGTEDRDLDFVAKQSDQYSEHSAIDLSSYIPSTGKDIPANVLQSTMDLVKNYQNVNEDLSKNDGSVPSSVVVEVTSELQNSPQTIRRVAVLELKEEAAGLSTIHHDSETKILHQTGTSVEAQCISVNKVEYSEAEYKSSLNASENLHADILGILDMEDNETFQESKSEAVIEELPNAKDNEIPVAGEAGQLSEIERSRGHTEASDSESDLDSFFDDKVKPSIVDSAVYLNLMQTTEFHSPEAEDSDDVENELAARVALPTTPVKEGVLSTQSSSDEPDEKQAAILVPVSSPKKEKKVENTESYQTKRPGWKMTTKEKLSALGVSVDSDSDVDIPHAVEASSDKDDFSF